jgi:lysozyme family protein
MDNFERCMKSVGVSEGGRNFYDVDGKPVLFEKSKNDRGGPTAFGITWQTLNAAYSQGLVDNNDIVKFKREDAYKIYEQRYWMPSRSNKMQWGLCLVHFDTAVNFGVGGAAKLLQRSLNDLAGTKVVTVDAVIGPASLNAIDRVDVNALCEKYLEVREAAYYGLVARDKGQGAFIKGWLNRIARIRKEIGLDG